MMMMMMTTPIPSKPTVALERPSAGAKGITKIASDDSTPTGATPTDDSTGAASLLGGGGSRSVDAGNLGITRTSNPIEGWEARANNLSQVREGIVTGIVTRSVVIDMRDEMRTRETYTTAEVNGRLTIEGQNSGNIGISVGISRKVIENLPKNMAIGVPEEDDTGRPVSTLYHRDEDGKTAKYRRQGVGLTGSLPLTQDNHVIHDDNQFIIVTPDGTTYVYTKVEETGT